MHFSMNLQRQKGFVEQCLGSYLTKDHLQASRNAKTAQVLTFGKPEESNIYILGAFG